MQQLAGQAHRAAMRFEEGRVLEGEGRIRRTWRSRAGCTCRASELVEQRRADTTRIENRFQPARGEVLNLLMAQLDPVTLGDAGADVAHDLFDINVRTIRLFLRARLGLRTALLASSIGAAATPVELPA